MGDQKKAGPEVILSCGNFEIVRWPDGNVQIRKVTYNPQTQQVTRQHINIKVEDAVIMYFLLKLYLRTFYEIPNIKVV